MTTLTALSVAQLPGADSWTAALRTPASGRLGDEGHTGVPPVTLASSATFCVYFKIKSVKKSSRCGSVACGRRVSCAVTEEETLALGRAMKAA